MQNALFEKNVCVCALLVTQSCPLFATPWTVTHPSVHGIKSSRQEYWSGLPFPSPGDLPDSEIEPESPTLQADSLPSELPGKPDSSIQKPLTLLITLAISITLERSVVERLSAEYLWGSALCIRGLFYVAEGEACDFLATGLRVEIAE